MTNKKEYKILRKTLSLTLAILVSILGLPLAKPQQVSATETSDPKFLSKVTITATAKTTWDTNYDTTLYNTLTGSGYTNSYTTEATALQISNAKQLAAFARAVNVGKKTFSGKYVKLTAPIDLMGDETKLTITKKTDSTDSSKFDISITGTASNVWVPIGNSTTRFKGTFDGGGHEVRNMTVLMNSTSGGVYAGLFGYTDGASIKNTGVTGNVYAFSSASSGYAHLQAGALVGYIDSYGSISNSYAMGNVYALCSSSHIYVGGLVGYDGTGIIIDSHATSNVYASASHYIFAGVLVGRIYTGGVTNSYATGDVYASSSYSVHAGGLLGEIYESSGVTNSYATGNVSVCIGTTTSSLSDAHAGGLIGYNGSYSGSSISNSYATGNVSAAVASSLSNVYAGGLVGVFSGDIITNSYATGNVSASSSSSSSKVYAGGLVGRNRGSITNGYYYSGSTVDAGTSGTKTSYGTGLTLEQITGNRKGRAKDNITGFSEDNWEFPDDNGLIKYLPRLKVITYNETTNPVPRLVGIISSDFDFKAPANSTYDGSAKEATITSEILEIPDDKITIKYYNSSGTKLTSPPKNAGTYTVKIDVAEGDKYEAQTDITADNWTFTITKADPTIYSTSTTAAYKPGLTLGSVSYPSFSGTAGSWIWSKSTTPISSAGTHYFEAKFKPTDSKNYNEVTKCILVTVSKATLQASDFNFAPPSNLEYSADYKTATITRKPGVEGIGELTVKYFTKVNGELTPLEGSSLPTDVGTYYVGINVGEDINYNSASGLTSDNWNFTITPAGKHTYRLGNGSQIYLVTK